MDIDTQFWHDGPVGVMDQALLQLHTDPDLNDEVRADMDARFGIDGDVLARLGRQ